MKKKHLCKTNVNGDRAYEVTHRNSKIHKMGRPNG